MAIHVRRHLRITASGKHATVRAHEREGDGGVREVPGWVRPAYVGDVTPPGDPVTETTVTGDWWDDDAPEPAGTGIFDDDPAYQRLKALRDSGYDGPVDQDGNPARDKPDALKEFRDARDRAAPDKAAERAEYRAARAELDALADRQQAAGIDWETDEYLAANARVLRSEKGAPWWRR